tara:strand:+ start:945 stop:1640 length:696 start_codon:yes stop_codon:yes gene_type:complete
MANLLYFRKERPLSQSFTITSTNVSNWANIDQGSATSFMTITGVGSDDIDSDTEFVSVTVTSAGSNSNIGSNYSAVSAGTVTTLDLGDAVDITDSKLRIEPASGSGSGANIDTANGYTLAAGDIVTVNFATNHFGLEQASVYPADRFIGGSATNGTTTVLHFNALKGTDNDDTFTVTHADGKFTALMAGINDCINADKDHKVQVVIDLMEGKYCAPGLGITDLVDAKVASY